MFTFWIIFTVAASIAAFLVLFNRRKEDTHVDIFIVFALASAGVTLVLIGLLHVIGLTTI